MPDSPADPLRLTPLTYGFGKEIMDKLVFDNRELLMYIEGMTISIGEPFMQIDPQFFINSLFSLLDFTGFTLLSLSIYRIPILMYWKRLLVFQFIFIGVMFTHDYVLLNKDFYALSIACTAILLSTVLLRIPLLYSSLIWGTGYLVNNVMQAAIILTVTGTGIISTEELAGNALYRNAAMFSFFLINLLIVLAIEKKRLGFMFIMNRFRLQKRGLQLKDYFIAILFICTVSIVQFGIVSFRSNEMNHYLAIILASMILISLIGLYITYKLNMQEIDERFSSVRRRKS